MTFMLGTHEGVSNGKGNSAARQLGDENHQPIIKVTLSVLNPDGELLPPTGKEWNTTCNEFVVCALELLRSDYSLFISVKVLDSTKPRCMSGLWNKAT